MGVHSLTRYATANKPELDVICGVDSGGPHHDASYSMRVCRLRDYGLPTYALAGNRTTDPGEGSTWHRRK
jgi:hypothetical protein